MPLSVSSQVNLVPNPSFEDTVYTPVSSLPLYFPNCSLWYSATHSTPDYYNEDFGTVPSTSFGFQYPHSGKSYAGLVLNYETTDQEYREYLQIKLDTPLVSDVAYAVGFYYSVNVLLTHTLVTNIGFRFSFDTLSVPNWMAPNPTYMYYLGNNMPYSFSDSNLFQLPEDTTSWMKLATIYTAQGGEEYLTIGNFNNVDSTSFIPINPVTTPNNTLCYYYIDDVFVIPLDSSTSTTITELQKPKQLLRIIDVLGRESIPKKNTPLFYRYDDGTVEKRIVVE